MISPRTFASSFCSCYSFMPSPWLSSSSYFTEIAYLFSIPLASDYIHKIDLFRCEDIFRLNAPDFNESIVGWLEASIFDYHKYWTAEINQKFTAPTSATTKTREDFHRNVYYVWSGGSSLPITESHSHPAALQRIFHVLCA